MKKQARRELTEQAILEAAERQKKTMTPAEYEPEAICKVQVPDNDQ